MGDRTGIEWADATWNPVRGCSRVSPGCVNCYAEGVARRFSGPGQPYEGLVHASTGAWNGTVREVPDVLLQPLAWRRPRRIFVNSMSDLFHETLDDRAIDRVFAVMVAAPHHTFQVLTKRPARMKDYLDGLGSATRATDRLHAALTVAMGYDHPRRPSINLTDADWPLRHVWLGVSVESRPHMLNRAELLQQTRAAVRWWSAEPLLDDLGDIPPGLMPDWVVVGGESGPGARPMHPAWARSLRDQCAAAGVPYLFKQWGEWAPEGFHLAHRPRAEARPDLGLVRVGKKAAGRLLDDVLHDAYPA